MALQRAEHLRVSQLWICTSSTFLMMGKIQVIYFPHEAVLSANDMLLAYSWVKAMLKFPRRVYFTEKKPESGGCVGLRKTWPAASKNSSQWASSAALKEVNCSVLELLFVPCKVHLGHRNSGFGSAFFFFLKWNSTRLQGGNLSKRQ